MLYYSNYNEKRDNCYFKAQNVSYSAVFYIFFVWNIDTLLLNAKIRTFRLLKYLFCFDVVNPQWSDYGVGYNVDALATLLLAGKLIFGYKRAFQYRV